MVRKLDSQNGLVFDALRKIKGLLDEPTEAVFNQLLLNTVDKDLLKQKEKEVDQLTQENTNLRNTLS